MLEGLFQYSSTADKCSMLDIHAYLSSKRNPQYDDLPVSIAMCGNSYRDARRRIRLRLP